VSSLPRILQMRPGWITRVPATGRKIRH
jgi:hypothetical protein